MQRSFWYTLIIAIALHVAVGVYFVAGFIAEQKALEETEVVEVFVPPPPLDAAEETRKWLRRFD